MHPKSPLYRRSLIVGLALLTLAVSGLFIVRCSKSSSAGNTATIQAVKF